MKIDLNELNYKDKIVIDEKLTIPSNYITGNIKCLEEVSVEGILTLSETDEYMAKLEVSGKMIIPDSITLEDITYPYSFTIDDEIPQSCINEQNMLDLSEFLWQNIVLEVPIRYTKSDATNLKGDHWEVMDSIKKDEGIDPRLEKLQDYFNEGGE